MHGADDHVVVPAAQVVVDVHGEQQAVVDEQLRRRGRRLAAEQGVTEVEQDADVVDAHLLDAERGLGGGVPDHLVARLARLVLDDELEVGVGQRELAACRRRRASTARGGRPGTGSPSRPGRARP